MSRRCASLSPTFWPTIRSVPSASTSNPLPGSSRNAAYGTLWDKRWLLWAFVLAIPLPYVANQVGWVTAEVGRQPWIVYGLLRTKDALSKSVTAGQTLASIILFGIIYALLFAVWLYVLNDKIHHGPDPVHPPGETPSGTLAAVAGLRAGTGGASLTHPDPREAHPEGWTPNEPGDDNEKREGH